MYNLIKMKNLTLLFLSIIVLFSSCKKEDVIEANDYSKGIFVVNEGPFQNGSGTITFYDEDIKKTILDVFSLENEGSVLGNIAQSMIGFNQNYYIAVNNGGKIQVVDKKSFKSKGMINIALPRYFVSNGAKLFVSAWGADFNSGAIFQINPTTLSLSNPINVGGSPEHMVIVDNILYVAISSVVDNSNRLVAIDINSNTILQTIEVGDNPNSLVVDKNKDLWVICSGNTDWADPTKSTDGRLVKIKNNQVVLQMQLSNGAKSLTIDKRGEQMYFLMDSKVWKQDITVSNFQNNTFLSGSYYALGIQHSSERIFLSDAKDFQSNGITKFFNTNGVEEGSFECNIIPSYFYFSE